jgi:general stress protein 26
VEKDKGIYFFSQIDSPKMDELQADPHCSVTFQDNSCWISLSGRTEIIRDKNKIDELWNEGLKPWFPAGKESADISLIKVIPEVGEHWDNSSLMSKLSYAFELGRAYVTNTRASVTSKTDWNRVDFQSSPKQQPVTQ